MAIKVGSAPDSWGVWFPDDERQPPWVRFMDEIAAAGYSWTELGPYGYLPTYLPTLQKELAARKLRVSGTFAMDDIEDPASWPELDRQVVGACESLSSLGAEYLVLIDGIYSDLKVGRKNATPDLSEDEWKVLIEKSHAVARLTGEKYNIRTVFHPHAETHVEYEGQIERYMADTDPELIGICLDTGHHAYRGGDPVAFYRQHHERIEYLHLKNIDPAVRGKAEEEGLSFAAAVAQDMFVEPARGEVDFIAFRDALREFEFSGFAIVEQDMYPAPFDKPLPIARRTRDYFREIEIG